MFAHTAVSRGAIGVTAILLLLGGGCGGEDEGAPAGPSWDRVTLRAGGSVEGASLGYVEYVPPGYGDGTSRPLLVFLHGSDESGNGSESALRRLFKLGVPMLIENNQWAEERPFIVLMPQYGRADAVDCRHADAIESFLKFATSHYDVDTRRVYLTGVSCGATGAWDYLAVHGDETVAAAVLIAGRATEAFATAGCALGRVPVWAFHGEADSIVPATDIETPIGELKKCNDPAPAEVRLTTYPGVDHEAWVQTYDLSAGHDIYAWLVRHERP